MRQPALLRREGAPRRLTAVSHCCSDRVAKALAGDEQRWQLMGAAPFHQAETPKVRRAGDMRRLSAYAKVQP